MAKDGGLRTIFRTQFRNWQWSTIEVGAIAGGIPDNEFCTPDGAQGWIEFKQTHIWYVQIKPLQVAWLERRCRYHGNAWIGVRRWREDADELWLMRGDQATALCRDGLRGVEAWCWEGGPSRWNFTEIGNMLSCFTSK
jgi:hypothetical protein